MKKNENTLDRLLRWVVGVVLLLLVLFWTWGVVQIILSLLAIVMFYTSIMGFCPLYLLLHINTAKHHFALKKRGLLGSIIWIVVLFVVGAWLSIFFSKKIFVEDFVAMNSWYKQLLFDSGKNKREESIADYQLFLPVYQDFVKKYSTYHPFVLKGDSQFVEDIQDAEELLVSLESVIFSWSLGEAHKQLEDIRATFQDILKRNNISLSVVALVDFHDVMEILISASDEKDAQKILDTYSSADGKLKEVEVSLNDQNVQDIRNNLEILLQLAKDTKETELSTQAQVLKTSFIKVYLSN